MQREVPGAFRGSKSLDLQDRWALTNRGEEAAGTRLWALSGGQSPQDSPAPGEASGEGKGQRAGRKACASAGGGWAFLFEAGTKSQASGPHPFPATHLPLSRWSQQARGKGEQLGVGREAEDSGTPRSAGPQGPLW